MMSVSHTSSFFLSIQGLIVILFFFVSLQLNVLLSHLLIPSEKSVAVRNSCNPFTSVAKKLQNSTTDKRVTQSLFCFEKTKTILPVLTLNLILR